MTEATWQNRVDALGRGHYRRYDERTSTMLADAAEHLLVRLSRDQKAADALGGGNSRTVSATGSQGTGPV